jgi:hypothetical protein
LTEVLRLRGILAEEEAAEVEHRIAEAWGTWKTASGVADTDLAIDCWWCERCPWITLSRSSRARSMCDSVGLGWTSA